MLSGLTFLLYWILKSFYINESGGLQIGDYVFVLSFLIFLAEHYSILIKDGQALYQKDKYFLIFIVFAALINLICILVCMDTSFFMPILFFVFNFLVIIEFRGLALNERFIRNFAYVTFLCILVQFIVYFTGLGRWYDGERYMGTFNDPNQLAFFVMSRFFILYLIFNHIRGKRKFLATLVWMALAMTLFLVIKSASTGMLLGIVSFAAVYLIVFCYKCFKDTKKTGLFIFIFGGVFIFAGLFVLGGDRLLNLNILGGEYISERLIGKINSIFSQNGIEQFIYDRNLQAFFEKPYYILFGSGEGGWERFLDVARLGELHSTVLGLLFYYGIVPFTILTIWAVKNLRYMKSSDACVYIALFIEMLTLINHRQSSLWIIFILPGVMFYLKEKKYD